MAKKKMGPNPRTTTRPVHRVKKKSGHGGKRKGAGRPVTGRNTVSRCYTASLEEDAALQEAAPTYGSIDATIKAAVRAFFGLD